MDAGAGAGAAAAAAALIARDNTQCTVDATQFTHIK